MNRIRPVMILSFVFTVVSSSVLIFQYFIISKTVVVTDFVCPPELRNDIFIYFEARTVEPFETKTDQFGSTGSSQAESRKFWSTHFVSNNEHICGSDLVFLLIMVRSKADHFRERHVIRSTWGNRETLAYFHTKIVFIIEEHGKSTCG